ncbi:SDR family oxidoreductase [Stakelama pacifica]|uniref:Short-subunit dehydrogenase n=1 Tax=Stakelama pacifica TaxID=517720 RepID=A0A4R6FMM1_9SPHN|nr:SDR family oxidoreductase [Stakelama pacifica]TDN82831.1 short-subunit dehydrogenase [Stakelama pacifica]GGO95466.1 short-chain dehydrogenase/reductase [Stakelama pacifica]
MPKTILITGASSGLGRASARLFHAKGWNVIATMRSPEHETELIELDNVLVTRLDVEEPSSIEGAVAAGIEAFGQIDVLLNNAGYGAYGPLEATPSDEIRRQFDVNLFGMIEATKALLSHFRHNRSGTIVNISSMGGRVAFPLGTLYHASKYAVEGFSEALSYEVAPFGVRIKLVEPGQIATDFAGRSLAFSNDETLIEYQPTVAQVMKAFGELTASASPAEVIAEIVYAAATDTTDRLRFEAGEDAQQLLAVRRDTDDASFARSINEQFGLQA